MFRTPPKIGFHKEYFGSQFLQVGYPYSYLFTQTDKGINTTTTRQDPASGCQPLTTAAAVTWGWNLPARDHGVPDAWGSTAGDQIIHNGQHVRCRRPARGTFYLLLLLVAGLTIPVGASFAVPCLDYEIYCHWVGSLATGGLTYDVAVSGDLACVANDGLGLRVVDITDPKHPQILGTANTPGSALGVKIQGTLAWVADQTGGLLAVDISQPSNPRIVGALADLGDAQDVAVVDGLAFVAINGVGLRVVDISDPTAPQLLSTLALPGSARAVATYQELVFMGLFLDGLAVVDVSDPAAPVLVGTYDTPGRIMDLVVDGSLSVGADATPHTLLYGADNEGGLIVLDVTDPTQPTRIGGANPGTFPQGVAIQGTRLYMSDSLSGLLIFDISDPTLPQLLVGIDPGGGARRVVLSADHAFLASYNNGLQVMNIAGEESLPPLLSVHTQSGTISRVTTEGSLAYLFAYDTNEIVTLDVSDPESPLQLGDTTVPHRLKDMVARDGLIYAVAGIYGLLVFDATNPESIVLVGTFDTLGNAVELALEGNLALVLNEYDGLEIIDISDPGAMVGVSEVPPAGWGLGVACQGDVAYVLFGANCYSLDISNPALPEVMNIVTSNSEFYDLDIEGGYAYLVGHNSYYRTGFLNIYDLGDPVHPALRSQLTLPELTSQVDVEGGMAYIANASSGLHVVDVSDPQVPVHLGVANTPDQAVGVCANGQAVLVADRYAGLRIYPVQCSGLSGVVEEPAAQNRFRFTAAPNPFNAQVRFAIKLDSPDFVNLAIHDLRGRLVAVLMNGNLEAGEHSLVWDGKDSLGRAAASGVYLVQTRTSRGVDLKKVALVK